MNPSPDETLRMVPFLITLTGTLTALLSWPLAKGKIGPNLFYGIRTKRAFSSEENWYKVNKFGGTVFLKSGISMAVVGLIGWFVPNAGIVIYSVVAAIVVLALVMGSGIIVLLGGDES